ncbi:oncoprotein-induced transcript 3 protein-like [Mizuhopecten yessoensis]|uniref:Oncoprotein-induced transcript 3 protein n=1 Tax=Mizuhopecten yessoensis TaxID=6573 RepID=A0A210QXN3_MIZYE|nr:oncoprotein-induced transcript 3 protein-like [Mizuhopecten yessoensis]OWF53473.1 Oncoprotein-induced transcript 3 protein [Mizuhopecten yessoensis]
MVAVYVFLIIFLDLAAVHSAEADPCLAHKLLGKMDIRGAMCSISGKVYCDRLIDGGWYKAVYKGLPLDMPTSCVNPASCGTGFPIWLNGNLPTVTEGVVQRQACVRGLVGGDCCIRQYNISVKNCGVYNVYNLPYTVACDEAYCFGDHDCGISVTKSPSSVLMSSTITATSFPTSQESVQGNVAPWSPHCKNRADIAAIVAGCLCSAAVGSLITFLVLYRCDGTRRGKVFLNNPEIKSGDPFCYSVFKSKDESKADITEFTVEDCISCTLQTISHK